MIAAAAIVPSARTLMITLLSAATGVAPTAVWRQTSVALWPSGARVSCPVITLDASIVHPAEMMVPFAATTEAPEGTRSVCRRTPVTMENSSTNVSTAPVDGTAACPSPSRSTRTEVASNGSAAPELGGAQNADGVIEGVSVDVSVPDGEPVRVPDGEGEIVCVPVGVGVVPKEFEVVDVAVGGAVNDAVGDAVAVWLCVALCVRVADGTPGATATPRKRMLAEQGAATSENVSAIGSCWTSPTDDVNTMLLTPVTGSTYCVIPRLSRTVTVPPPGTVMTPDVMG